MVNCYNYLSHVMQLNSNLQTKAIGFRISYDTDFKLWNEEKPALYFHLEGDHTERVSDYLSLTSDEADAICKAHNNYYSAKGKTSIACPCCESDLFSIKDDAGVNLYCDNGKCIELFPKLHEGGWGTDEDDAKKNLVILWRGMVTELMKDLPRLRKFAMWQVESALSMAERLPARERIQQVHFLFTEETKPLTIKM